METSSLAYVFNTPAPDSDDDMYPFLGDEQELPLSPSDQALLMGVYPATMSDFDFHATIHAAVAPTPPPPAANGSPVPDIHELSISVGGAAERSKVPDLLPPSMLNDPQYQHLQHHHQQYQQQQYLQQQQQFHNHQQHHHQHLVPPVPSPPVSVGSPSEYEFDPRSLQAFKKKTGRRAGSSNGSPSCSPLSNPESDVTRDSEEILNAPVKSLTEEEKKLRRRAQVAKSARKHRNRQKEELARLREQVQQLQEQMARMKPHDGGESAETIKMEQDEITQHRKRKKVDDEPELTLANALTDQSGFATAVQHSLDKTMAAALHVQHWFNRLPVDTLERTRMLHHIADKRMSLAPHYLEHEFGNRVVKYPQYDIKLNSNGPDMEIKLLRAKEVPGYTHVEVGEAAWNSIFNFQFDVPDRFKPHVKCDRLMELDDNTRYGRTIVPLLKNADAQVIYLHSYFVVRRKVTAQCTMITWEAITVDDLHPFEPTDTTLRNDEVGCTIFETAELPSGQVQTLFRTIIHSTPPVNAITEPRGKINEAFLTVFCRNADIVETSARNLMRKNHPGRVEHVL